MALHPFGPIREQLLPGAGRYHGWRVAFREPGDCPGSEVAVILTDRGYGLELLATEPADPRPDAAHGGLTQEAIKAVRHHLAGSR